MIVSSRSRRPSQSRYSGLAVRSPDARGARMMSRHERRRAVRHLADRRRAGQPYRRRARRWGRRIAVVGAGLASPCSLPAGLRRVRRPVRWRHAARDVRARQRGGLRRARPQPAREPEGQHGPPAPQAAQGHGQGDRRRLSRAAAEHRVLARRRQLHARRRPVARRPRRGCRPAAGRRWQEPTIEAVLQVKDAKMFAKVAAPSCSRATTPAATSCSTATS